MVNFSKTVFYLTFSFVAIASYFSVVSHFQNIENRKNNLDKYYIEEFDSACSAALSEYKFIKEHGEQRFEDAVKDAYSDGYYRAEVSVMRSNSINKALREKADKKQTPYMFLD